MKLAVRSPSTLRKIFDSFRGIALAGHVHCITVTLTPHDAAVHALSELNCEVKTFTCSGGSVVALGFSEFLNAHNLFLLVLFTDLFVVKTEALWMLLITIGLKVKSEI